MSATDDLARAILGQRAKVEPFAQPKLRVTTGVVQAVNDDGTVDINLDGNILNPDVPTVNVVAQKIGGLTYSDDLLCAVIVIGDWLIALPLSSD